MLRFLYPCKYKQMIDHKKEHKKNPNDNEIIYQKRGGCISNMIKY